MSTDAVPEPERKRPLGFWMATALVIGNMIGSGIYLLPASLAPLGWNAVFGWIVTIAGALCVATVFARLARTLPLNAGPYAYTRIAFGPLAGFAVAWTYWLSVVVGNAAIATGSVSYLSILVPAIARIHALPPTITLATIWGLTALNCWGTRPAGGLQLVATIVKLLPLGAVIIVAAVALHGGAARSIPPLHPAALSVGGMTAAATLALWGLLGLESATVPADKVADASRTVPRATIFGTALTGLIYLLVCSAILLLMPANVLANSPAPFADFLGHYWGGQSGPVLAAFAAISGFGALNGWVLLQGEMASAMARGGVFPQWLGKASSRGTPVRAQLLSTAVLTVTVLANYNRSLVDLFTFVILLSTAASLFMYLFTAMAALHLQRRGRIVASAPFTVTALLAAVYSGWAIYGAGREAALWGVAFLLSALPIYAIMRWRRGGTAALTGPIEV